MSTQDTAEIISITKEQKLWYDTEENYLNMLSIKYEELSDQYMTLYENTFKKQTGLRLPAIALSSISGIFSFGSTSFPDNSQKYVSIGVGIINIFIAMLQTYESYFKVNDTVVKSLNVSLALRKLSDKIHCELCIPITNRTSNGDDFLREIQNEYEKIISDAPPILLNESSCICSIKDCTIKCDSNSSNNKDKLKEKSNAYDIYKALRENINIKYNYLHPKDAVPKIIIETHEISDKTLKTTTRNIINI